VQRREAVQSIAAGGGGHKGEEIFGALEIGPPRPRVVDLGGEELQDRLMGLRRGIGDGRRPGSEGENRDEQVHNAPMITIFIIGCKWTLRNLMKTGT
jgi:hypothetical protein